MGVLVGDEGCGGYRARPLGTGFPGTTVRGEGVSRPTTSTPLPQVLRRGLLRTILPSQFAGGANTLPRSREA